MSQHISQPWAFCGHCHGVQELGRDAVSLRCRLCRRATTIARGPVNYGRLTCPGRGVRERLIDVAARVGGPPRWRLLAVKTLEPPLGKRVPMAQRQFRPATAHDHAVPEAAARALERRRRPDGTLPWVPGRRVPREDRADDRLVAYGYDRYRELFDPRQLLHLSLLAEAIAALDGPEREALAIAFSDHLATNCRMAHYAFGWRRLAPLFSVRAYRHVARPVEINPWLDDVGRGPAPILGPAAQRAAQGHGQAWSDRLARDPRLGFRPADRTNFLRACLVAAALGLYGPPDRTSLGLTLREALERATIEESPGDGAERCPGSAKRAGPSSSTRSARASCG